MQRYPAIITAAFLDKSGDPALGLLPGICIYQLTSTIGSPQGDALVVGTEGGSPIVYMTEIGKGFYKYVFTDYDSEVKYAYQIDGEAGGTGPKLGNGRLAIGTNQNFAEDIAHEVWEEPQGLHALGGSPETVTDLLRQIFNATVGSPTGAGASFTLNQIIAGVWGETLLGSPQPYPPGSAGNLLAFNNQLLQDILETSEDLGGSPRINLATTVWNTIITGSPQPFQPGSAGNTLFLTSETVNNIDSALDNLTTCLFGSPKVIGSPRVPLTVSNIVSATWSQLLAGSPAPYPTGSAGGLINQIAQSAGLTPAQVTAAVWNVPASNYPATGSPTTMGSNLSLTTANTTDILDFTELLLAAQYNRTFLDKVAATLTVYGSDQTTPIRVFSLRDSTGTPSITEIVDRVPISGSPLVP